MNIRINSLVLIYNKEKVLLQKGYDHFKNIIFYRPLGGGIEFGEKAVEAVKREIMEEIGATLIKEKFLTVFENIFEFNGNKFHEITFLFTAELAEEEMNKKKFLQILDKKGAQAEWVLLSDIKNGVVKILPENCINFM